MPIQVGGQGSPGPFRQGGKDILQPGDRSMPDPPLGQEGFRGGEDQRDPDTPLIGPGFTEGMVVAQQFPMIRGKQDNGIFHLPVLPQRLEQPPDLMVQVGNAGIIANLGLP